MIPGETETETGEIFYEIMTENFLKLLKDVKSPRPSSGLMSNVKKKITLLHHTQAAENQSHRGKTHAQRDRGKNHGALRTETCRSHSTQGLSKSHLRFPQPEKTLLRSEEQAL